MSGFLNYLPDQGDFYLKDLEIHESNLPGLPSLYDPAAQELLAVAARTYMNNIPVYTLRNKDFNAEIGRLILRSVSIQNGILVATLDFPD